MKVRLILLALFFSSVSYTAVSQELYAIKPTSDWTDGLAWSTTSGGLPCSCTPTAADDVYTNGNLVVVNTGAATCKNLFINYDIANSVTINSFVTLTITGTLTGWNAPSPAPPITSVIKYNTGSSIRFTGANVDLYEPYIIFAWSSGQPIGSVNFALTGVSKNLLLPLAFTGSVTLSAGTLTADAGAAISGTSSFSISSGATFISNDPIGPFTTITVTGGLNLQDPAASLSATNLTVNSGGSINASGPVSVTNNITVTGALNSFNTVSAANMTVNSAGVYTPSSTTTLTNTLTINTGGQVNSSGGISSGTSQIYGRLATSNFFNVSGTLNLNSGSNLSTSYTGGTEGWWSGTSAPATINADIASTVTFSANSAQNLFAQEYGNLTLTGSGAKTVTGPGTLNVKGNLSVGSAFNSDAASAILIGGNLTNSASWAPADEVTFNGTGSQQIAGTVLPTFNGGVDVNKSAGILSLLRTIRISTGLTISQGTFDASTYTTTLSGSLTNNGTLTFGAGASLGTLIIDGTTAVTGTAPSFGHLTINSSRSFSGTGTINIAGNITNNGTFSPSGIALNGTSSQNISGTLTLSTLIVRDGANVANLGTINMTTSGVVTLEGTAIFDAGAGGTNTVRLRSTALSNGARIAMLPNPGRFSGNVTVERYINGPEDWRYLSIPVVGANVGMLQDNFPVTGAFGDADPVGGNVVNSEAPSIFYLNAGQWTEVSGATTGTTSLSNTRGYSVWTYLSQGTGVSLDVDGEIGKGPIPVTITSGDNLIPNPYPSAIDWDLVDLSNASLSTNAVYLRTANGQYASYVQGGPSAGHPSLGGSWTGQLASGQSFWVVASGSGSITYQEDDKVGTTNFVREAQPADYLRIRLQKDDASDDVVIHFKEGATIEKDVQFDALKKLNDAALNISTYNTDPAKDYAINGVPFIQCEFTSKVKLGTTNPQGAYSLAFEDLSSMNVGYEMLLIDQFLDKQIPITENLSYAFSITEDPASGGAARFEIVFKTPSVDLTRELTMESAVDCDGSMARISIHNSQPGINYQFLMNGSTLNEPVLGNGGSIDLYVSKAALSYGLNSLNLLGVSPNACHSYEFTNAFTLQYDAVPQAAALSSSPACSEGSAILSASGAPEDGSYRWYQSEDSALPIEGVSGSQFVTPALSKSETFFVAAVNASGCEGTRIPMTAEVVHLNVPEISIHGDMFEVAEGLGVYQWYFNGEEITGANSNTYQVKKSGDYTVSVSSGGCSVTSDGMEFLVNGNEHKTLSDYYSLYPNPIDDVLTVTGPDLGLSKITVYDRTGQLLAVDGRFEVTSEGETIFLADFTDVRNGVYLMNIQSKNRLIQLKVIKR